MNCSSKIEHEKMYIKLAGGIGTDGEMNRDETHEEGRVVDEIEPKTSHYPKLKKNKACQNSRKL